MEEVVVESKQDEGRPAPAPIRKRDYKIRWLVLVLSSMFMVRLSHRTCACMHLLQCCFDWTNLANPRTFPFESF